MLDLWPVKSPSEIVEREWEVPAGDEDSLASFTATLTGATLDASERNGDTITLTISGGTAGVTATVAIAATTTNGLIDTKTFYQPIRADGYALGNTVRDVCDKALRVVTGNAETASSAELDDAVERLSDMLAAWAGEGADLKVKLPCAAGDTLSIPDWAIEAIKANLTVALLEFYGAQIDRASALAAQRGLQRIKFKMLPSDRESADFF